ncbi:hypothetical protein TRFO_19151 [Tritrichomonas foetus]|uniref:Uncharacterized protein n=1 Tax=Tritrichomonas foetus TaxID=1144522 RepID=A0A1J4KJ91_9EUKA|nr:hypothetical protein TRFO_19151 [Tritrichomonas foetus]|eukprot:OHT11417.1 hypothetical protein TRFO_19151 [Tritrichomonas foetus]
MSGESNQVIAPPASGVPKSQLAVELKQLDLPLTKEGATFDQKSGEYKFNDPTLQKHREAFRAKMTEYEQNFWRDYTKPEGTISKEISIQDKISSALDDLSKSHKESLQTQSRVYSDKCINIDDIPGETVLFNPELQGLAKIYTLLSDEAINNLENRLSYLNDAQEGKLDNGEKNYAKEIEDLYEKAKKQVTSSLTHLDISEEAPFNLIVKIAEFFDIGIRGKAIRIFNHMSDIPTNNINLQSAIIYAHSGNNNENNIQFLTKFVYIMLLNMQCANLIRTLSKDDTFLKQNYYADAPIRDPIIAEIFAVAIEKIECAEITGEINESKAPLYSPPVSPKKFAQRVSSTVDDFLTTTRKWLLEDIDIQTKYISILYPVLRLFMDTFLTQSSGEIASISALWDVFESISSQKINGSSFQKFQKILSSKEVTKDFSNANKAIAAIAQIFNQGILPEVVLWGVNAKPVKGVKNPVYSNNLEVCKMISEGFHQFKYTKIQIQLELLKEEIQNQKI